MGDCRGVGLHENFPNKNNQLINLRRLDITNHGIENLSSSDLSFTQLNLLIASHNHLTNISASLFIHTTEIDEIDFSYNEFDGLYSEILESCTKIIDISLKTNFNDL